MGYNLTIGNVEVGELLCEDGEYHVPLRIAVIKHDKAPHDGSLTDGENQRWPSYSGWSDFCTAASLHSMFYDDYDGLLRQHPGVFELTPAHLEQIKAAQAALPANSEQHGRLEWLRYWVEWALASCERPAIKNS